MNQEVKTKWVEALRSGDYEQATGRLRGISGNGFCCLGVLCDIVDPEGWTDVYSHRGAACGPVRELAGPIDLTEDAVETLITLNDDQEYTFDQIAYWIEDNL